MTMALACPAQSWDEELAAALVLAAVRRKLHLFEHFRDQGEDDLVQDMLIVVRRAFRTFDREKGSFSTFVSNIAGRRLISRCRDRTRQAQREAVYADNTYAGGFQFSGHTTRDDSDPERRVPVDHKTPVDVLAAALPPCFSDDEEAHHSHVWLYYSRLAPDQPRPAMPLADWLSIVYLAAGRTAEGARQVRNGRHFFRVAQVVTVGLLMQRLHLSVDAVRALFLDRPDLRRAVHFQHVPAPRWFADAWVLAAELLLEKKGAREALAEIVPELPPLPSGEYQR